MMRLKSCAVVGMLGLGLAGLLAGDAASVGGRHGAPAWAEIAWPFLRDQWPDGRAFRCGAGDCGAVLTLTVRVKAGFCNCTTGVADDDDVDRVRDADLLGDKIAPLAGGHPVTVGWMRGRSRPFEVTSGRNRSGAVTIAFNDKCDVVVATIAAEDVVSDRAEAAALAFLNGGRVLAWTKVELGL